METFLYRILASCLGLGPTRFYPATLACQLLRPVLRFCLSFRTWSCPVVSRRHSLGTGLLVLWPLQSSWAPFCDITRASAVEVVLYLHQQLLGTPWPAVFCILTNCRFLQLSLLTANSFSDES